MSDKEILELAQYADQRLKPVTYSRVMGYTIPVERFNVGKQGEHRERKYFKESVCAPLKN